MDEIHHHFLSEEIVQDLAQVRRENLLEHLSTSDDDDDGDGDCGRLYQTALASCRCRRLASPTCCRDVKSRQKKRIADNRFRIGKFFLHLLVFLLPLAVEVVASAASSNHHHNLNHHHLRHSRHMHHDIMRHRRFSVPDVSANSSQWPVKRVAEIAGDVVIGGLHMIHEREDAIICGPVMPQGGLQAWISHNMKKCYYMHLHRGRNSERIEGQPRAQTGQCDCKCSLECNCYIS